MSESLLDVSPFAAFGSMMILISIGNQGHRYKGYFLIVGQFILRIECSYFCNSHPTPAIGDVKRNLILCNLRQRFFLLDSTSFYQSPLLLLNLLILFLRRTFLRPLFHQLALYSQLQNACLQLLRRHSCTPPSSAVMSVSTRSISAFSEARSS